MERWYNGVQGQDNKKTRKSQLSEKEYFSDEAFSTLVAEEESMISSHPLRAATDDINDLKPITSNCLLIGKSSQDYKPCAFQMQGISLRKTWKSLQEVTEISWKR